MQNQSNLRRQPLSALTVLDLDGLVNDPRQRNSRGSGHEPTCCLYTCPECISSHIRTTIHNMIGGTCNTLYIQHLLQNTCVTLLELHNGYKRKSLALTGSAHLIIMINRVCRWFCSDNQDVGWRWCLSQTWLPSTWRLWRYRITPAILMDGEWGRERRGSATQWLI